MNQANNNKILTIIITCFGKKNQIARRSLRSARELLSMTNQVEVLFLYKNMNDFNYDWAQEEFPMVKTIGPVNSDYHKFGKMVIGFEEAKGKFVYVLDADDILISENIVDNLEKINSSNSNIIIFDYIRVWNNTLKQRNELDGYKFSKGKRNIVLTNFNVMYHSDIAKKTIPYLLNVENVLLNQDLFYNLLNLAFNKERKIDFLTKPILKYFKYKNTDSSIIGLLRKPSIADSFKLLNEIHKIDFTLSEENKKIVSYTYSRLLSSLWLENILFKRKINKQEIKSFYKKMKYNMLLKHKFMYILLFRIHLMKRYMIRWIVLLCFKKDKN